MPSLAMPLHGPRSYGELRRPFCPARSSPRSSEPKTTFLPCRHRGAHPYCGRSGNAPVPGAGAAEARVPSGGGRTKDGTAGARCASGRAMDADVPGARSGGSRDERRSRRGSPSSTASLAGVSHAALSSTGRWRRGGTELAPVFGKGHRSELRLHRAAIDWREAAVPDGTIVEYRIDISHEASTRSWVFASLGDEAAVDFAAKVAPTASTNGGGDERRMSRRSSRRSSWKRITRAW